MIDSLLQFIAPHSCCGCGYLGALLCEECKNDIVSEPFSQCLVCLRPTSGANLCMRCRQDTLYENAWCIGVRDGALKGLLDRYKFDSARRAGREIGSLLASRLPLLPQHLVIVPVPTSAGHRRARGFDHTALFSKHLASLTGLSYQEVLATDRTDTQHFKSRSQRHVAAQTGLRIKRSVPEHIMLIDDIYTTGSTLRACTRLLRQNGAVSVSVAVVARQTLDGRGDLW